MWDENAREKLLGNTNNFLNKFCTPWMRDSIKNNKLDNIKIENLRKILHKVTNLMSFADFSDGSHQNHRPLILIGCKNNNMDLVIGVFIRQNDFYFYNNHSTEKRILQKYHIQPIFKQTDRYLQNENKYYLNVSSESLLKELENDESALVNYFKACNEYISSNRERSLGDVIYPAIYPNSQQFEAELKYEEPQNNIMYNLNTILYGAPGTGKTYSTIEKALEIAAEEEYLKQNRGNRLKLKEKYDELVKSGQISFVTFHQSFSYEEFVEGIRAETKEGGSINYSVKPGIFREICKKAAENSEQNYVLIIDEINRGNISKIFGELITLIEESKRDGNNEALKVTLPYSGDQFSVPNNLYIIGTMNTADRSLALMDTALRRRFDFVEMMPQPELLREISVGGIDIEKMLTTMNKRITVLYDREHTLGHAFFMPLIKKPTIENLANIFKNKIIPLLQEYFFEDWEKIRKVLGDDKAKTKIPFITKEDLKGLFEDEFDDESSILYTLNEKVLTNAASYINIYE